jgi:hypothetical protein
VLKKDSSQPILDGKNYELFAGKLSNSLFLFFQGQNPGPLVEIEFWKAKAINLENIYEQVRI